jgi:hypothetical protein
MAHRVLVQIIFGLLPDMQRLKFVPTPAADRDESCTDRLIAET